VKDTENVTEAIYDQIGIGTISIKLNGSNYEVTMN
jgi:hypothetical protein